MDVLEHRLLLQFYSALPSNFSNDKKSLYFV